MRFAKIVFIGAGVWGLVVLTPFYWLLDVTGRRYSPPANHPQFFYGFLAVALSWQIAFLVIGSNPIRFRPLMIPAVIEKLSYVATVLVLRAHARIPAIDVRPVVPDLLLGLLFIAALATTRSPTQTTQSSG